MRPYVLCLLLLVLVVLPSGASAKDAYPMGLGATKCAAWVAAFENNEELANQYRQWLYGLANGYNAYSPDEEYGNWFPYDEKPIPSAITSQCKETPEKLVSEVAVKFIRKDPEPK